MIRQSEKMCEIYIAPDERRLLARVAQGHGVGSDYLALKAAGSASDRVVRRPIPQWPARQREAGPTPAPRKARCASQERHCRACTRLSPHGDGVHLVCAAGVWTIPMLESSIQTSRHLRALSKDCPHYQMAAPSRRQTPRHCRACAQLVPADTVDERYVCSRAVWSEPMKPLSVANARRLARLSATCPHFVATTGRWLPRS